MAAGVAEIPVHGCTSRRLQIPVPIARRVGTDCGCVQCPMPAGAMSSNLSMSPRFLGPKYTGSKPPMTPTHIPIQPHIPVPVYITVTLPPSRDPTSRQGSCRRLREMWRPGWIDRAVVPCHSMHTYTASAQRYPYVRSSPSRSLPVHQPLAARLPDRPPRLVWCVHAVVGFRVARGALPGLRSQESPQLSCLGCVEHRGTAQYGNNRPDWRRWDRIGASGALRPTPQPDSFQYGITSSGKWPRGPKASAASGDSPKLYGAYFAVTMD